jgi:hypothetical protein
MKKTSRLYIQFDAESLEIPELSKEQLAIIASDLQDKHAIFYKLFELGKINFSYEVDTACVKFCDYNFDNNTEVVFLFNPVFWINSTEYFIMFIICHEMLHIILNHGMRAKDVFLKKDSYIIDSWNIATDLVINHILIDKLSFIRERLDNWEKFCWIDTVFANTETIIIDDNRASFDDLKNKNIVVKNQCAEYYITRIIKAHNKNKPNVQTVDLHGGYNDSIKKYEQSTGHDPIKNVVKKINKITTDTVKQQVANIVQNKESSNSIDKSDLSEIEQFSDASAGCEISNTLWKFPKKSKDSISWKKISSKWAVKNKDVFTVEDTWFGKDRRLSLMPNDIMLPWQYERNDLEEKNLIDVWAFLDVSGSCGSYKKRFFDALNSIPKSHFKVKSFVFSTSVQEIKNKSDKIKIGGGTSFAIIERFIYENCKHNYRKYPKVVFIITDGYGDSVFVKFPKRWHWFLIDDGSKVYIPRDCNVYKLSDFES